MLPLTLPYSMRPLEPLSSISPLIVRRDSVPVRPALRMSPLTLDSVTRSLRSLASMRPFTEVMSLPPAIPVTITWVLTPWNSSVAPAGSSMSRSDGLSTSPPLPQRLAERGRSTEKRVDPPEDSRL